MSTGTGQDPAADAGREDPLEPVLAWAILAPLLLLCTPLLVGVPTQVASGAGAVLLASLPALMLAALRGVPARPPALLLLLAVFGAAGLRAHLARPPFDSFSADRELLLLGAGTGLALAASSLGARGRAVLARGSLLAAALLLAFAAVDTLLDPARSLAGSLENTGHLAAAALPGALVAAAEWSRRAGPARVLTLATLVGFALYAGLVPVLGAALAFLLAALLGLGLAPGGSLAGRLRRRGLLVGALAVGAVLGLGRLGGPGADGAAGAAPGTAAVDGETAGAGFRLRTWARLDEVLADHPWSGLGPGQFEAGFPPYRDPAEIELSTFGRTAPFETQVEHPHNDWLLVPVELGLPLGLLWLAFLAWVSLRALAALRSGDGTRAALGLAWLGLASYAGLNGALLGAPASSALAFALAGAVLARGDRSARTGLVARLVPALLLALLASQAGRAVALLRHGLDLRPLAGEALVPVQAPDGTTIVGHEAGERRRILQRALARASDSPLALAEWADLARRTGATRAEQEAAWSRLLSHQPLRFEALMAMGNLAARAGEREAARGWYERAAAVDARHPGLLLNRVQLRLDGPLANEAARAGLEEALEQLTAGRRGEDLPATLRDELRRRGARQLLAGRPRAAAPLLERVDPRLVAASGEEAYQLSGEFDGHDGLVSDAYLALAHQLWGREHVAAGDPEAAVRSFRQSLRASRHHPPHAPHGALTVRLELAAALVDAGRADQARLELEGERPDPLTLLELDPRVGQVLLEAGLLGP